MSYIVKKKHCDMVLDTLGPEAVTLHNGAVSGVHAGYIFTGTTGFVNVLSWALSFTDLAVAQCVVEILEKDYGSNYLEIKEIIEVNGIRKYAEQ